MSKKRDNRKKQDQRKKRSYQRSLRNEIRTFDDPILRQICDPIEEGEDVSHIISKMKRVLSACNDGVGLAAPQIGVAKNIVLTKKDLNSGFVRVMVNPIIVDKSEDTLKYEEGCLSYPGEKAIVTRYKWVKVQFTDEEGRDLVLRFDGFEAIVVQHELDHLSGVCRTGDAWREKNSEVTMKMV